MGTHVPIASSGEEASVWVGRIYVYEDGTVDWRNRKGLSQAEAVIAFAQALEDGKHRAQRRARRETNLA